MSLVSEYDSAAVEIVGGEFEFDSVAGDDFDEIATELARGDGEYFSIIFVEFNLVHSVGQTFSDGTFVNGGVFVGHRVVYLYYCWLLTLRAVLCPRAIRVNLTMSGVLIAPAANP